MRVWLTLLGLLAGLLTAAAEVISTNATITLDERVIRADQIFDQPANGAIVTLNPPQFSWRYSTNNDCNDIQDKSFVFQASASTSFASPLFSVATPLNFFNFLDAFTNSPIYWRVGYVSSTNSGVTNWNQTRSFTIATNAVVWNRAAMTNYDGTVHPRVLFRSNDISGINSSMTTNSWWSGMMAAQLTAAQKAATNWFATNWANLTTNMSTIEWTAGGEQYATNEASAIAAVTALYPSAVFKSYWYSTGTNVVSPYPSRIICFTNEAAWTNNVPIATIWRCYQNTLNVQALLLAQSGFYWQFNRNASYTNHIPDVMAWLAEAAIAGGLDDVDFGDYCLSSLAYTYDWYYEICSPAQRSKLAWAFSRRAYSFYNFQGINTATNSLGFTLDNASLRKGGENHVYSTYARNILPIALATFGDSTTNRLLFDAAVNYAILRTGPSGYESGINLGRGYGDYNIGDGGVYKFHPILATFFKTNGWTNHPGLKTLPTFQRFFNPVGMRFNGDDTWGDGGNSELGLDLTRVSRFWNRAYAIFASALSGNGGDEYHRTQSVTSSGSSPSQDFGFENATFPFYYQSPAPAADTNTAACYPLDGWVMGYASNPSVNLSNNVGFIFQARPSGAAGNHIAPSDLDVEFMAYGAHVTEGGGPYGPSTYQLSSFSRNLVMVDNRLMRLATTCTQPDTAARLLAYRKGSNYIYAAGSVSSNYYSAGWLLKNERHLLFMRGKYLVIYDNLASRSNSTFTWSWKFREPTLTNLTTSGFHYTCSNLFNGFPSVSNIVAQIVSPSSVGTKRVDRGVTAWSGSGYTNRILNHPFTGEVFDYYDKTNVPCSALYITNNTPATNWHFMTVVYPVKFGQTVPTITRVDDNTVAVTNGAEWDIITFDTNQASASSLVVDIGAVASIPDPSTNAPSTPSGLQATASSGQVALSWNSVSYATSYILERTTTSGSGYSTVINTASTSYTDTGLNNGTTYYYTVLATNSYGASAKSAEVSATPASGGGGGAPDQPPSDGGKARSSGQVIIRGGRLQ